MNQYNFLTSCQITSHQYDYDDEALGTGNFGSVCKCYLKNIQMYAAMKQIGPITNNNDRKLFMSELQTLATIHQYSCL